MDLSGINGPCKDCKERQIDCHSKCLKYQEFTKLTTKIRKKEAKENDYVGFRYMVVEDGFKRRRNKNTYIKQI